MSYAIIRNDIMLIPKMTDACENLEISDTSDSACIITPGAIRLKLSTI